MASKFISSLKSLSVVLLLAITILTSCGGGGGGGEDFVGAAVVRLQISPTSIDTADRMLLKVDVREVNENGIALKFKFPVGLKYVTSSSTLSYDDVVIDISPAVNDAKDNFRYLVYYISQSSFSKNKTGTVELFLEGVTRVIDGDVEVDADVDNPLQPNDSEFNVNNPEFAAEDSITVNVEG